MQLNMKWICIHRNPRRGIMRKAGVQKTDEMDIYGSDKEFNTLILK